MIRKSRLSSAFLIILLGATFVALANTPALANGGRERGPSVQRTRVDTHEHSAAQPRGFMARRFNPIWQFAKGAAGGFGAGVLWQLVTHGVVWGGPIVWGSAALGGTGWLAYKYLQHRELVDHGGGYGGGGYHEGGGGGYRAGYAPQGGSFLDDMEAEMVGAGDDMAPPHRSAQQPGRQPSRGMDHPGGVDPSEFDDAEAGQADQRAQRGRAGNDSGGGGRGAAMPRQPHPSEVELLQDIGQIRGMTVLKQPNFAKDGSVSVVYRRKDGVKVQVTTRGPKGRAKRPSFEVQLLDRKNNPLGLGYEGRNAQEAYEAAFIRPARPASAASAEPPAVEAEAAGRGGPPPPEQQ